MTRFGRLLELVSGWVGAARGSGTCAGIAGALLGLCEHSQHKHTSHSARYQHLIAGA